MKSVNATTILTTTVPGVSQVGATDVLQPGVTRSSAPKGRRPEVAERLCYVSSYCATNL